MSERKDVDAWRYITFALAALFAVLEWRKKDVDADFEAVRESITKLANAVQVHVTLEGHPSGMAQVDDHDEELDAVRESTVALRERIAELEAQVAVCVALLNERDPAGAGAAAVKTQRQSIGGKGK